jgi:sec-independent protein translocase protein TatB
MFDIGWSELLVIGIVALIAIGPKELPGVLRAAGQWMGKIRRMANEFQGQFQEAMREAELSDLQKQATEMTNSITNFDPLSDTQKEIERSLDTSDPFADGAAAPVEPSTEAAGAAPESLPAPAEQTPFDVPLPDTPAGVTEKDFASAEAPVAEPPKQAGGGA